ncbi:MAG: zinc dependent phospholipase C family protein [Nitrospiraceae bacterium]|nr:zinc dependent phospholipase C family protein [Nitrospiraceae bacterium]
MAFILLLILGFTLVPSFSFAWGPLTHMYLGSEIFSYAPLIPAGIYGLLRSYRQDYLYGNLMADSILGKQYLPDDKSSHSWEVGLRLLDHAQSWPEKAFAYGYLSHLAADTVAHGTLTEDKKNVEHAWLEMQADGMINKLYWLQSVTFSKAVQRRNDLFMENTLDRYLFSFKTNKRIYKSMVFLSLLNRERKRGLDREQIVQLHDESIARILDLLQNGTEASVLTQSPLSRVA